MSDEKTILYLARRSLLVLVAAMAISLALYAGSRFFKDRMQARLAEVQQIESASLASLAQKQSDLANLQSEIDRFTLLRQQGMVGAPDREGWTEQLLASRQRTGLPDTLIYTLQVPRPLATQGTSTAGAEAAPASVEADNAGAGGPLFHDLDFALGSIHEEELLSLLRDYQAHVKGSFRVNACALSARTETGLSAHCTLRFFTLPDAKPDAGKQ